jgi:glycosyltransferase involved in cell wall biosynthesis
MKVVILHPDFSDPGGVAKYYTKLKDKFTIPVQHCIMGRRPEEKGFLSIIYRMIYDYAFFLKNLKKNKCEIILVNPSLDFKSFVRDGIFLLLARTLKKKTIVFFRGWHEAFEFKLKRNYLWLFKYLYGSANAFIVLSGEFKKKLEAWGFTQPIYCEVTVTDDNVLNGFDINDTITERLKSEKWRILFLSRIIKTKGIYETIEAFTLLQTKYPKLELIIAGDGDELESVKSFVRNLSISNILFTGYVNGEEKNKILKSAHILCFPSYSEGLPNTIIESMAFGLPIVTRLVGGITDFFKNGEHGFATTSKKPEVFADFVERLLKDRALYRKISLCNYEYAMSNFLASSAARRLEKIYESLLINK